MIGFALMLIVIVVGYATNWFGLTLPWSALLGFALGILAADVGRILERLAR